MVSILPECGCTANRIRTFPDAACSQSPGIPNTQRTDESGKLPSNTGHFFFILQTSHARMPSQDACIIINTPISPFGETPAHRRDLSSGGFYEPQNHSFVSAVFRFNILLFLKLPRSMLRGIKSEKIMKSQRSTPSPCPRFFTFLAVLVFSSDS